MWRAAGVSYLRYSNEMAELLRKSLKEPLRTKALDKNQIHLLEKKWANGVEQSKTRYFDASTAYEAAAKAAGK